MVYVMSDPTSAAQLAELNVLQLMSDNSAAALQFGVFRRTEFNATPNVSCGGVVIEGAWLVDVLMFICC